MLFRQYLHADPVAISYLFGCGSQSQGVLVDPLEAEVDFYIDEAKSLGMNIVYVIDTHLHADHLSGARRVIEKTGAKIRAVRGLYRGISRRLFRIGLRSEVKRETYIYYGL
jgi:glyoxylase-like metal-dependent hydrolase (beta-lactamase superfamily II)